jgi:hypothetical protein
MFRTISMVFTSVSFHIVESDFRATPLSLIPFSTTSSLRESGFAEDTYVEREMGRERDLVPLLPAFCSPPMPEIEGLHPRDAARRESENESEFKK